MAVLALILVLVAACFPAAGAKNPEPCQPSKWNNGYNTFIRRHVREGIPASTDHNQWMAYIKNNGGCSRPTQSFLDPSDLERVRAVCTAGGGRTLRENMCISEEPFSFVTVRSEPGTCGIRNVVKEKKHLILACEVLENQCLPVHFEGNPENLKPGNNARGCQEKRASDGAAGPGASWSRCLLAFLLLRLLLVGF